MIIYYNYLRDRRIFEALSFILSDKIIAEAYSGFSNQPDYRNIIIDVELIKHKGLI